MDIFSLVVGFALGIIIVALVMEFGMKKIGRTAPSSSHAKSWSIDEIRNPKIMAEYLSDMELPKNSKVLVNKYKSKDKLSGINAREHRGIKGNFIVGDDRALILAGPLKKNEVAFWTVEEDIVRQLNQEFDEMWTEGTTLHQNKET